MRKGKKFDNDVYVKRSFINKFPIHDNHPGNFVG